MNNVDGVTDLDVVLANLQVFKLLRRLSPASVSEMLEGICAAEWQGALADRMMRYREHALQVFARVPPLARHADTLAQQWAEYRFNRQSAVLQILMYLEDPRVEVLVYGADRLNRTDGGQPRGPVLVSAHLGPYHALVGLLARIGIRTGCFLDKAAEPVLSDLYRHLAPALHDRAELIGLPDEKAARRALTVIRSGRPLVVYPEFSLSDSDAGHEHTTHFIGREVYAPTGPARLARICRVPVIPVRLTKASPASWGVEFLQPLYEPGDDVSDTDVTDRIFGWLEAEVCERPSSWWCWEIFEEKMAVRQ